MMTLLRMTDKLSQYALEAGQEVIQHWLKLEVDVHAWTGPWCLAAPPSRHQ